VIEQGFREDCGNDFGRELVDERVVERDHLELWYEITEEIVEAIDRIVALVDSDSSEARSRGWSKDFVERFIGLNVEYL